MKNDSLVGIKNRIIQSNGIEKAQVDSFINAINSISDTKIENVLSVSTGSGYWDYILLQNLKGIRKIIATDIVECPVYEDDQNSLKEIADWEFVRVGAEKELPLSSRTFDLVIHEDVIEHVSKPYMFINEQFRVLRDGGYLIFGTPNLLRTANVIKLLIGKLGFPYKFSHNKEIGDYIHIQEFTKWQLETLLKEAGFSYVQIKEVYFGLSTLKFTSTPKSSIGRGLCHYFTVICRK